MFAYFGLGIKRGNNRYGNDIDLLINLAFMEWIMDVPFRGKQYLLKAQIEYKDEEIIKVRVYGLKSTVLLETEYKRLVEGKLRWKFLEGAMKNYGNDSVQFQFDMLSCLEFYVRNELCGR